MRIIIVEDNHDLRRVIVDALKLQNFDARGVEEFTNNELIISNAKPDLLIIDQDLPNMKGTEIIKKIRATDNLEKVFIIMLSAHTEKEFIKKAYDYGADDYLAKPLDLELFIKKVQAIKRRLRPGILRKLGILFDAKEMTATISGKDLELTKTEFHLLYEMAKVYPETAHRKDLVLKGLRGVNVTIRTIDVHVCYLRKKVEEYNLKIETIRNKGYRLTQKD
jgi:two-component system phosphate regulon response regulator PhoB